MVKVGDSTVNEPTPTGNIIAQGTFTAQNGRTLTGAAQIYLQSNSTYVLRIENLTAPAESNLQIRVKVNGQISETFALRNNTGTQNYTLTQTGTVVWNSIDIYSIPNILVYGIALLE